MDFRQGLTTCKGCRYWADEPVTPGSTLHECFGHVVVISYPKDTPEGKRLVHESVHPYTVATFGCKDWAVKSQPIAFPLKGLPHAPDQSE